MQYFCGLIEYYIADRLTILGDFFFDGITSNIGKYKQELYHRHTSKNIHGNAYHDCVELDDVVICISEGLSITSIIERTHDHRRLLHVYAFID